VSALAHLLHADFDLESSISFEAARDYFCQDPDRSIWVRNLMAVYKITDEMVYARALGAGSAGKFPILNA